MDTYLLKKPKQLEQEMTQQQDKQMKEIKEVIFKTFAPFYSSETDNSQLDNSKDLDVVRSMYNLIEYSDNYSKTFGSLWQYYRDESNANLTDLLIQMLI